MISEYHINLLLSKLENVLENQRMILQQLVLGNNKISGHLPERICKPKTELPNEAPDGNECQAKVSVDISDKDDDSNAVVRKVKTPSNTQLFKEYRMNGGRLSWRRWKLEGRPRTDDKV